MPGITVFGQIAIVVGALFVALHYGLIVSTPSFVGDLVIGALGVLTVLGYALIKAPRSRTVRLVVRVAFVWSGLVFLSGPGHLGQLLLDLSGVEVGDPTVWLSAVLLAGVGYVRARSPKARLRRMDGPYERPLRLLHLSDLHIGDVWSRNDLDRVVRRARHYRPDCVVITGDLLDGMEPVRRELLAPLRRFEVPVYFVSGNHDSYTEREDLLDALEEFGVVTLEGAISETDAISVLGIGYATDEARVARLVTRFSSTSRPRVVLKHKPDGLSALLVGSPDAVLCGHVHGGQIWPLGYLGYIEFPHVWGTHWYDRTMLHVSQGSATWGPPFRLGTRSEFTVVDFVPAEGGEPAGEGDEL